MVEISLSYPEGERVMNTINVNVSDLSFTFVLSGGDSQVYEQVQGPLKRERPISTQAISLETTSDEDSPVAWLAAHIDEVVAQYAGKWILVHDGRVVAASNNPTKLENRATRDGIENPLITQISKEPAVWKTAYAP
jgi:hypothetical protein